MTVATVAAIGRFLRGANLREQQLSIVWHAGEPLTVPVTFYDDAFRSLQAATAPMALQHHFQTNAMLIDDDWCALFKRWAVRIGISVDGPKDIHDAHRVDRSGRGTYDRVMRGVSKLREHEIPFTVIGVLTPGALQAPDALWRFFSELGAVHVGLNVEEAEGVNVVSSLAQPAALELLRGFLLRATQLQASSTPIGVREFDSMRSHLTAPPGCDVMRADNMPGSIVNVDVHGNVTTFSPELLGTDHPRYGKFHWGNVHTDQLADIVRHPGFQKAYRDIRDGIEQCRATCGYFSVCGGGNPSNKLAESGSFATTETQYCRLHVKTFADALLADLEREMGLV
jgi:uncharacterized protein